MSILECAGAGIFGVDAERRVTFANQAALDISYFGSERLVGKHARCWVGLGALPNRK